MRIHFIWTLLVVALLCPTKAYCHNEWVHQHIIKEAFELLEDQFAEIPALADYFQNYFGDGSEQDDMWEIPWYHPHSALVGAWIEDHDDPIWDAGVYTAWWDPDTWFGGWVPSSTHFWKGDDGDFSWTLIPLSFGQANAWTKARLYAFGKNENSMTRIRARLKPGKKMVFGPWYKPIGNGKFKEMHTVVLGYRYQYPTLHDFYDSKELLVSEIQEIDGQWSDIWDQWIWFSGDQTTNNQQVEKFCMNILGRLLHLLADMSVPAHTHNDMHPCPLTEGDAYELMMSSNSDADCDTPHEQNFSDSWSMNTAKKQGGLIWEALSLPTDKEMLRYLYYTTNQLADRFPTAEFDDLDQSDFSAATEEPGNTTLSNGSNNWLNFRYSRINHPLTGQVNVPVISDEVFNYVIRASATLIYWFFLKADRFSCPNDLRIENSVLTGLPEPTEAAYEGFRTVTARGAAFDAETQMVEIRPEANVRFRAGESIRLLNGFRAHPITTSQTPSSKFRATASGLACQTISKPFRPRHTPNPAGILDLPHVSCFYLNVFDSSTIVGSPSDTVDISSYRQFWWIVDSTQPVSKDAMDFPALKLFTADTVYIVNNNDSILHAYTGNKFLTVTETGYAMIFDPPTLPNAKIDESLTFTPLARWNPNSGRVSLEYIPTSDIGIVKIYDILGKEIKQINSVVQAGSATRVEIDLGSHMPKGVYYVQVNHSNRIQTFKFLVP